MGKHPLSTEDDFLPFTESGDSIVVESAYLALGDKIRSNYLKGGDNREIFEKIRVKNPGKLPLPAVKALARIGMGYSNEYLVRKCSDTPECLASAVFQNGDTEPLELVKATIGTFRFAMLSNNPLGNKERRDNELLRQSLLYRLKDREKILNSLFEGGEEDRILALKLLAILRNGVEEYESRIVPNLDPLDKKEFILAMSALQGSSNYKNIVEGLLAKQNTINERRAVVSLITESHRN